MFQAIKKFFSSENENSKLIEAEISFDNLMRQVDDDTADLTKLEGHVRDQFKNIQDDVDSIRAGIDELIMGQEIF